MARSNGAGARGSLRIIGGAWRGRRLAIADAPGLRPTPDRIRETLFNWLAPRLPGSRCLDAFAGTGALGLEALSRGASKVLFVESSGTVAAAINDALTQFEASGGAVMQGHVPGALAAASGPFDIVFLDPPFDAGLWQPALEALPPLLAAGNRVYLEYPSAGTPPALPEGWQLLRRKTAGEVGYCLASWAADGDTRPSSCRQQGD